MEEQNSVSESLETSYNLYRKRIEVVKHLIHSNSNFKVGRGDGIHDVFFIPDCKLKKRHFWSLKMTMHSTTPQAKDRNERKDLLEIILKKILPQNAFLSNENGRVDAQHQITLDLRFVSEKNFPKEFEMLA